MVWGLDDDFVGPDAIHFVEHALGLAVKVAFDAEGWKLVRNDAHRPAGRIALRWRSPIGIWAISLDLRRRFAFVPWTKRAETTLDLHTFTNKICRALGAISGNDHPASNNGILPEFGQLLNPFNGRSDASFYDTGKAFLNNSMSVLPDGCSP